MPDIYPILVDNDEMQELFNILAKYQDTILQMAKVVGGDAANGYDRATKIINGLLDKADAAVSPPSCLSKECLSSDYCYKPSQCEFVRLMKAGHRVARISDGQLALYAAAGWEVVNTDERLAGSAKRNTVIHS